jgi:hypothetical protein
MPWFAIVAILKFVVLALTLYVMIRVLHLGLIPLAVGFLVAQIAITAACIRSLTSSKLIDSLNG